ncbi:hypothetical protein [Ekhidna sp.]|uniref:hypothetical protein n=1 Tax=Ekhidna sp. TaxID=2608089 RepID=UPI003C7B9C04
MNKILSATLVYCLGMGLLFAQNTRTAEIPKQPAPRYQAVKKEKKSFFSFLKKKDKPQLKFSEEERLAFRKRVSKAYAENAKIERKSEKIKRKEAKKGVKFHGHKRPPKKRPPGKQKFCKICRIKH